MDRKWWTLVAVLVGVFMLLLDITIVNVALPSIQKDLDSSFSDLQWVVDAYALSLASTLLVSGSVADLIGRRRVFVIGLVLFSLASLGCGLVDTPLHLNLFRALQGIGGGMMFATSLALIAQAFQGRERGIAFGAFGAVVGASVAIGPVLGGILTDAFSWQAVFLVNIPVGIGAVALTLAKVDESRDPSPAGVDFPGAVTLTGFLFFLIFALVRGNAEGWGSTLIVTFLSASVVLLALFVFIELRREHPLFDLTLLRKPAFLGASLAAFALSASMFSMFLYLTLYLQGVLDLSPLDAGLRFLPLSLLSFVVGPVAGRLSEVMPVRWLMGGGLLLVSAGLLLMHGVRIGDEWTTLLAGFVVAGIGIGFVNPPLASTAIGVVEQAPQRHGLGREHHLPPGGPGHRHRGPRRDLPAPDRRRRGREAGGHAGGLARGRVLGGGRGGRDPAGGRRRPTPVPWRARRHRPRGVHQRHEHAPDGLGDRGLRGRDRHRHPGAAEGLRGPRGAAG